MLVGIVYYSSESKGCDDESKENNCINNQQLNLLSSLPKKDKHHIYLYSPFKCLMWLAPSPSPLPNNDP